jgi:predicted nuclease of predicted toxin-antitoxin system
MKIKLDENMPNHLVVMLSTIGHEVDTVMEEGMAGRADVDVWERAQNDRRFLITQDLDFSNIQRFRPGTHHGLLLVRLRNPGRLEITRKIQELFETEDCSSWQRCFVVLTDKKLRVQRPKQDSDL